MEKQVDQSPAEFFAEHQAIAGFDNLGKSLYTSLRELVENGLDACESIRVLPSISIELTEYTQTEFNRLYLTDQKCRSSSSKSNSKSNTTSSTANQQLQHQRRTDVDLFKPEPVTKKKEDAYFALTVKDNGCGIDHVAIPNLLGKVLSGSKYGVRQTRGKFGLGAKMALIWGKKSSGQPIVIKTSHRTSSDCFPNHVSECTLDIDVYRNEPKILSHTLKANVAEDPWIGTSVSVVIAGNWTTYKTRVLNYLQQLAIITPYADLEFVYRKSNDFKKKLWLRYERRSEQMPPLAQTSQPHPSGVNNLILQQLIQNTQANTLAKFLSTELTSLNSSIVSRILAELGYKSDDCEDDGSDKDRKDKKADGYAPRDLSSSQITRMAQVLRSVACKGPDASVLSPLGEYNLNLGITKVLDPDLVATCRDRPGSFEGHCFIVEAAVSLGGKSEVIKEGIQVYRFANRIPLLFEGGADVSTRVANSQIKWSNYKIDPRIHKIGVFVSIVSTKIPFKGTSKEYIGDDATGIQLSVKRALQSCCQQLRVHLIKRQRFKSAQERQSKLQKYIPDVSRSLFGLLDSMKKRLREADAHSGSGSTSSLPQNRKRLRTDPVQSASLLRQLGNQVTTETFADCLKAAVKDEMEIVEKEEKLEVAVPVFLVPLYNLEDPSHDFVTRLFSFRPLQPINHKLGL